MGDRVVTEPAPAKLNPFLRVVGPRPDGYHDIETLILPLTLADGVQVIAADDLRLRVVGERAGEVPSGDDNLAIRAAQALRQESGTDAGAQLLVSKKIPAAAGLGGGSADAAATLRALNELWGLGLGTNKLAEIGAAVGSDVPALMPRGPVVARGRGERVEVVPIPRTWWVLVTFDQGVSTADAYGWWDEQEPRSNGDAEAVLMALENGDADVAGPVLFNDLEPAVLSRRDDVRAAKEELLDAGATGAVLCGSGPTVAGLARD
ncbi:MAG TPA: 4-(cytidine 5'-diphospho)-2-C-methyl-D-erythritol kinase, partial [Actinomycetota bacterium]|nr:4-(cytidine 5'-diphospho)-2-C-methyl-D-erythritol kinase [Actinomycetota bacterium]